MPGLLLGRVAGKGMGRVVGVGSVLGMVRVVGLGVGRVMGWSA